MEARGGPCVRAAAALMAPGAAQAKTTLVEVHSTSHAVLNQLEALGLDVTYEGETRTELMLHGPEDVQILKDTGYAYDVLMDDMDGANDARLKSEDEHQAEGRQGHRAAVDASDRPRRLPRPGDHQHRSCSSSRRPIRTRSSSSRSTRRRCWARRSTASRSATTSPRTSASRPSSSPARTTRASGRRPSSRWSSSGTCCCNDGDRRRRDEPAREGQADRDPGRQRRRVRPQPQPAERAEAQELPDHLRRRPDARGLHAGGERQPRHRPQPQLPPVLGRPGHRAPARRRPTRAARPPAPSPRSRA